MNTSDIFIRGICHIGNGVYHNNVPFTEIIKERFDVNSNQRTISFKIFGGLHFLIGHENIHEQILYMVL